MKLSIIIPAHDEARTIEKLLKKVRALNIRKEIIVVDDGSKDNTADIVRKICKKDKNITLISYLMNRGKGHAIRTGLHYAKGDVVIIQDADLEYDPHDYKYLLAEIKKGADVVYGSRFLTDQNKNKGKNYIGNQIITYLTNLLYHSHLTDMETCYKMMRIEVLNEIVELEANKFDIEPEITARILQAKYEIVEVPISYNPRNFEEGKKINWKDGLMAIWTLIKCKIKQ